MLFKKLKSENGFILAAIFLPLLILLSTFSVIAFGSAINHANQTRILYNTMQARYNARLGIEYATVEVTYRAISETGGFVTHIPNENGDLIVNPACPSATDASQPMLAGWINIIAAVHGGTFKEAKAW